MKKTAKPIPQVPLVIGEKEMADIARVCAAAEANVFTLEQMMELVEGETSLAGDHENLTVNFPNGYRAVFSLEIHPAGLARHLSVSVNHMLPPERMVQQLMPLFGFKNTLWANGVWIENLYALNVLEMIDGTPTL